MGAKAGQWILKRSWRYEGSREIAGLVEPCHNCMKTNIEVASILHADVRQCSCLSDVWSLHFPGRVPCMSLMSAAVAVAFIILHDFFLKILFSRHFTDLNLREGDF